MADYKHGAYGKLKAAGEIVSKDGNCAIVYVGTAPVQQVRGYANSVNKPIAVKGIAEARKYFGYSEDIANYTLMEAVKVHFEQKGVGPIVLINVLDPATHKGSTQVSKTVTPVNGKAVIADAEKCILDTITVTVSSTAKTEGTDYSVAYDYGKKTLTIAELTEGALGASATVTYYEVKPEDVDTDDIIGETDGVGNNSGIYAVKNVYQLTGYVPTLLMCPGFSGTPAVHTAMLENSVKINGHWDAWVYADIPLVSGETAITIATAKTWKATNGYNNENETVFFPMIAGSDGNKYHISVIAAANWQEKLIANGDIPFMSASNTDIMNCDGLYLGQSQSGAVLDDEIINENLNKYGICSAAYISGRWAVWGAHAASYTPTTKDELNVSETNGMMLRYLTNDFQRRRTFDVDTPMTANDIKSIAAEEQARIDALIKIGALLYGVVTPTITEQGRDDVVEGDFTFEFSVTTHPLAKSLTAVVVWTDKGFEAYYESFEQ